LLYVVVSNELRFLLPVLQVQAVLNAPTLGEMEEALELLPSTVHGAFDKTLDQIKSLPEARRQLGIKTLMWIFYSRTGPYLKSIDLREALAIRPGQKFTNSRLRPSTEMILTCCRGLVTYDKTSSQIHFIHDGAVREYLEARSAELFPNGQELIAESCLDYLETESAAATLCEEEEDLQEKIITTPFLWYAVLSWGYYIRNSSKEALVDRALALLLSESRRSSIVQISEYLRGRRKLYWSVEESKSNTVLHAAALFGFDEVVLRLLEAEDNELDATTSIGTTALMRAASGGYIKTMELLLKKGADTEKKNWYGSCLHAAVEAGQLDAVSLLLEFGVDMDMEDDHGRTPMLCAFQERRFEVARLLAQKYSSYQIPLGYRNIMVSEDSLNQDDMYFLVRIRKSYGNALAFYMVHGRLDIARVLLANGASTELPML
jgi:hypothetical protein